MRRFHFLFSVLNRQFLSMPPSPSSLGRPHSRLLTLTVLWKATRASPDPLLPGCESRERGEGTLSWGAGSWVVHPVCSIVHSFLVCLLSVALGLSFVFVLGIQGKQS